MSHGMIECPPFSSSVAAAPFQKALLPASCSSQTPASRIKCTRIGVSPTPPRPSKARYYIVSTLPSQLTSKMCTISRYGKAVAETFAL